MFAHFRKVAVGRLGRTNYQGKLHVSNCLHFVVILTALDERVKKHVFMKYIFFLLLNTEK